MVISNPDHRYELVTARAEFVDGKGIAGEAAGVPPHVLASWRRSLDHGVSPEAAVNPYFTDLDTGSRLAYCAAPVIEHLAAQLADLPMCVALTDSQARILARHDGSRSFARATDRVHFAEGFGYAEGTVGTNGVGTVLESGESVHITGAEHFVETLQTFACAGAPIRDPFTRRIEGVLDISCFADHSTPILHSMVRSAARQIEHHLVAERSRAQHALFEAYTRTEARSRDAVIAVGPRMSVKSARAEAHLHHLDLAALEDHARFRMHAAPTVDETLELPSGTRVRFRGSTITDAHEVAGMVCVVGVLGDGPPQIPTPTPTRATPRRGSARPSSRSGAAPTVESTSPAMRSAVATLTQALRTRSPVIVLGERGAGRSTLLRSTYGRLVPDGRVVVLSPAEVEQDHERVVALTGTVQDPPSLVVLRDIEELSLSTALALAAGLGHRRRGALVAATTTSAGPVGAGCQLLLPLFACSASIPPLRHRTPDLPSLVVSLLVDLAPHRDVRLAPEAQRILAGYRWPGNLAQLREALTSALARRPVGVIEAQDLPGYCQSAPRSALRPVDQAERDAIVAALHDVRGNRKAAAEALGLARSTLYRKLRQYGIGN